jgi:integrase
VARFTGPPDVASHQLAKPGEYQTWVRTPSSSRDAAASLAVRSGANVKAVQRMLGHGSAAITLDVCSGLFDDDLDGVADRLDEAQVYSL